MFHNVEVNYNKLGNFDKSFDFQSTVDRNINLQNLKRASAFIDIMDRHLDTVLNILPDRFCHIANTHIPGSPGLLELLQGRPGQGQDDQQQGDLQEVRGWLCLQRPSHRYEIEWIGREGLAPETHDAYLKVETTSWISFDEYQSLTWMEALNFYSYQEFINHFYKNTLKLIGTAL